MKLVMTVLARDEEDVIEANLLYHLNQGVDFVIALDNGSVDGTVEIFERYVREGCLHLMHEPDQTYENGKWSTRMARLAATEFGADWVINNDSDEFWWPESDSLKEVLAEIPPEYQVLTAPRDNFAPRPGDEGLFAHRMTLREVGTLNKRGDRTLPPKVAHRADPEVVVSNGNHRILSDHMRRLEGWHPITILHFPVRSYAQWERKLRDSEAARRRGGSGVIEDPAHRLLVQGRLEQHYLEIAPSDEEAERRVGEGRLVVDRRLETFLRGIGFPPASGGDGAAGAQVDSAQIASAERSARMAGSLDEHARAVDRLEKHWGRRVERSNIRRKRADRRRKRAEARLERLERSLPVRAGRRAAGLASVLRSIRGRASAGRRPPP